MLVSDIIKDLLEIMRVHGDLEVLVDCESLLEDEDEEDLYNVTKVEVTETVDLEKVASIVLD